MKSISSACDLFNTAASFIYGLLKKEIVIGNELHGGSCRIRLLNDRAVLYAGAASRTQVHVNTAGAFSNFYLEISGFALDRFQIGIGDELDV